jgi:fucose permease
MAGLVQGLALVTFPAAGSIFTSREGYALSPTQYGAMFLPQVAFAILASATAPALARRWSLRSVFMCGLAGDLASMVLLALSRTAVSSPALAYVLLLVATGALGAGFGATVTALNTFAEEFFPHAADRAVLAMNVLLGTGTALAPLLVASFAAIGAWWLLPIIVACVLVVLLLLALRAPLSPGTPRNEADAATRGAEPAGPLRGMPVRFWLYAAAALLYGMVETLNGNWSMLYLVHQRGIPSHWASLSLTAFWAMVTVGRLLASFSSGRIPARSIYLILPVLTLFAFLVASKVSTAPGGIMAFGLAGLACSAFLPLTISFGGEEFSRLTAVVSGELIAFYQAGYGIAAFGVGPLQDATGILLSAVYAWASVVGAMMAVVAFVLLLRPGAGRRARGPS